MSTTGAEPATVLDGIDAVKTAAGTHLGWSAWREITQAHVEAFAAATGSPATDGVAPYQTVALSNFFLPQIVDVRGVSLGVNYGCDRIRFPAPVATGERLRAGAELTGVVDIAGGRLDSRKRVIITCHLRMGGDGRLRELFGFRQIVGFPFKP